MSRTSPFPNGVDSSSSILPHNPLVARNLPYIRDTKGRPRYLGPTSTWSFCRRALMLLEAQAPSPDGLSAPLNLDGTAFRLRWQPKPMLEPSDLKNLPPMDYAFYLYNTVKYHLGELFGIIDEPYFLAQFERFHKAPWETARAHTLWFTEYLLILAYGKAFLAPSNHSGTAPPGSEFAARAMALLPDPAQLHDEGMLAIEFLALIGQAVRLCYIEGIQRQVPDDVVSPGFASRCNTAWWTVYVLEHELTALMGGPPSIPEDDITTELPFEKSASLPAKALTLRIRLSKLIASMCNTVYGVEKGMGDTFVRTTTTVLHQLAEVSRELEHIKSSFDDVSRSELPHMLRNTMLSYHHCIVLATRPLVMWLLMLSMPPATMEPQQLARPIATLLQTSAESATANIFMLRTLAEHDMLETFLPFQLEYGFSSAMLLCILGAILPTFVPNENWHAAIDFVLDEMVKKKNPVARLRKSELNQLDALLNPLRGYGPVFPDAATSFAGGDVVAGLQRGDVEPAQLADDDGGFEMPWDSMGNVGNQLANPDQMLELAEQIGTGDLLSSFFFEC
ncbi:hypothetical protein SLS58_007963 [Diplodia intermedia]|uniref:Xylanolytic transcriptional activator regulatory domain-containing protein n=1 Tax=Diplodia intermedia TaxID=856260 RepID=A0ABR3TIL4_9PEZI